MLSEHLDLLAAVGLFGSLTPSDRTALAAAMELVEAPAGALLHAPGEDAPGLDVLLSGTVVRDDPALAILTARSGEIDEPGAFFSKGALILPVQHRHRLRAVSDVRLARLGRDVFLDALSNGASWAQALLDALLLAIGDDIRDVNEAIRQLLAE